MALNVRPELQLLAVKANFAISFAIRRDIYENLM